MHHVDDVRDLLEEHIHAVMGLLCLIVVGIVFVWGELALAKLFGDPYSTAYLSKDGHLSAEMSKAPVLPDDVESVFCHPSLAKPNDTNSIQYAYSCLIRYDDKSRLISFVAQEFGAREARAANLAFFVERDGRGVEVSYKLITDNLERSVTETFIKQMTAEAPPRAERVAKAAEEWRYKQMSQLERNRESWK